MNDNNFPPKENHADLPVYIACYLSCAAFIPFALAISSDATFHFYATSATSLLFLLMSIPLLPLITPLFYPYYKWSINTLKTKCKNPDIITYCIAGMCVPLPFFFVLYLPYQFFTLLYLNPSSFFEKSLKIFYSTELVGAFGGFVHYLIDKKILETKNNG